MTTSNSIKLCATILFLFTFLIGCGETDNENMEIKAEFSTESAAWSGSFADYTAGTAPDRLAWRLADLPSPLTGKGLLLSGNNHSDDLFVYVKRKYSGLKPNKKYEVRFQLSIATNVPADCLGVGGAPGESVWMFAGASDVEPVTLLNSDGNYRVNIDRGNQSLSGKNAQNLGDIATSIKDCSEWIYQKKTLISSKPLTVTSDPSGDIWIMIGMDSGYESYSEVYLISLDADLIPSSSQR